jgi:tetratricopeptide (TPR) repeat protein
MQFPQGPVGEAAYIHNQGMRIWRAGRLDEALAYFLRALALKEKSSDLAAAASSIHMIGVVYAQKKDWENATRYFLRSLAIDAGDRHGVGVAKSLNDIATMCGQRGDDDARRDIVGLGNALLGHLRGGPGLDQKSTLSVCKRLPADLRDSIYDAVRQVMRW